MIFAVEKAFDIVLDALIEKGKRYFRKHLNVLANTL